MKMTRTNKQRLNRFHAQACGSMERTNMRGGTKGIGRMREGKGEIRSSF